MVAGPVRVPSSAMAKICTVAASPVSLTIRSTPCGSPDVPGARNNGMVYCSACAADHPRKRNANAAAKDFRTFMIESPEFRGLLGGRNGRLRPSVAGLVVSWFVCEAIGDLPAAGTGRPATAGNRSDGGQDRPRTDSGHKDGRLAVTPSARLGSARLGSARLGSARLGSARLGSARLGSARLGSARLGSARLGSARLGNCNGRFGPACQDLRGIFFQAPSAELCKAHDLPHVTQQTHVPALFSGSLDQASSSRTRIAMFSATTKPSTHLIAPTSARNPA